MWVKVYPVKKEYKKQKRNDQEYNTEIAIRSAEKLVIGSAHIWKDATDDHDDPIDKQKNWNKKKHFYDCGSHFD